MIYTTVDGDILDAICFRHYGSAARYIVEQVLVANHGLADRGVVYEAGLKIILPELAIKQEQRLELWD